MQCRECSREIHDDAFLCPYCGTRVNVRGTGRKAGTDSRTLAALGVTLVLWASAFAGIRAGLEAYGPGHLALFRFLVASLVLAVYAVAVKMPLPRVKDLPGILLLGFLGITVYHTALTWGELTVTAGAASLLIASAPVLTCLWAMVLLRERITPRGWIGIVGGFLGASLIAAGEGGGVQLNSGALLVLLAALSSSLNIVLQKPYLERYSAIRFAACSIWAGTLFMSVFLPGLAQAVRTAPLHATLAVVYLGAFPGALAYVAWTYALSRIPASTIASFLYLVPILAVVIAWIWLGEMPTLLALLGGVLSLAGVALVNTRGG